MKHSVDKQFGQEWIVFTHMDGETESYLTREHIAELAAAYPVSPSNGAAFIRQSLISHRRHNSDDILIVLSGAAKGAADVTYSMTRADIWELATRYPPAKLPAAIGSPLRAATPVPTPEPETIRGLHYTGAVRCAECWIVLESHTNIQPGGTMLLRHPKTYECPHSLELFEYPTFELKKVDQRG